MGNDNVHGGTPGFMAPEVPKEGGSYKSDIYSVGKVMIEIMTCRSMEEVYKINYNSLIDSTSLFPEFDYKDKFISIVRECIQIDPNERPNINELYKKYKNQILLNYQSYKNIITQKKTKYVETVKKLKINQEGFVKRHRHPLVLVLFK